MAGKRTWSLHLENTALKGELQAAKKTIKRLEQRSVCGYCGHRALPGKRVCSVHSDLPEAA